MVPFPTLPTESLYKFLSIAGLVTILSSLILLTSQTQQLEIENIKLRTNSELYSLKIKKYNTLAKEANDAYRRDKASFAKDIAALNSEKKRDKKKGIRTDRIIDGKTYSPDDYENFLIKWINASQSKFNKTIDNLTKEYESTDIENIRLNQQRELIEQNLSYSDYLTRQVRLLITLGILLMIYGFYKWHQMQVIADDLLKYQLAKAKTEQEQLEALRAKELADTQLEGTPIPAATQAPSTDGVAETNTNKKP